MKAIEKGMRALGRIPGLGPSVDITRGEGNDFTLSAEITDPEALLKKAPAAADTLERHSMMIDIEGVINVAALLDFYDLHEHDIQNQWLPEAERLVELINKNKINEAWELADQMRYSEFTDFGSEDHEFPIRSESVENEIEKIRDQRKMMLEISLEGGKASVSVMSGYPERHAYSISPTGIGLIIDDSDGMRTVVAKGKTIGEAVDSLLGEENPRKLQHKGMRP